MKRKTKGVIAFVLSVALIFNSGIMIPEYYRVGVKADDSNDDYPVENVTSFNYEFAYDTAGYADGTISISANSDGVYKAFWGDKDGNKLSKNGYEFSYFARIIVKDGKGACNIVSDYTAIPEGASTVLIYKKQDIQYVYNIPEERLFMPNGDYYTFGALSDPHFGRYSNVSNDDAVDSMEGALAFMNSIGVDFIGISGDLTAGGEQSSFDKYNELLAKYPDITVLACTGNHDSRTTLSTSNKSTLDTSISRWYNSLTKGYFTVDTDGMVTNYLKYDVIANNALSNPITTYYRESEGGDAIETAVPGMDFAVEVEGNIIIFLNEIAQTGETYDTDKLLTTSQMNWLQEQLAKYQDKNVFVFFHSFLGANTLNDDVVDYSNCTGDLKNEGGYSYNLDFIDDVTTTDGMNMQALLSQYSNVHMLSGHSHWQYAMQEINPNLNIGRLVDGDGATLIHISSVTAPRYIGREDTDRMDLTGYASEGTTVTVYEDCIVYNCIDFYNKEYEAYGTYIVPVGEQSQYAPVKNSSYTESEDAITGDEYLETDDMTIMQILKSDYNLTYAKEYIQSTVGSEDKEGALVDGTLSGYSNTERSSSAKNQNFVIDLGKDKIQNVTNIDYFMLFSENTLTNVTEFEVLISLDGVNYESAGSYKNVAIDNTKFIPDFSDISIDEFRYVKLQLINGNTNYGYQIKEFAVIGLIPIKYEKVEDQSENVSSAIKNIALNKTVFVSSVYADEGSNPDVLTDGKKDKYWSSDWDSSRTYEYIIIDLGKEYDAKIIKSVLVNYKSDNTFCGNYSIEFSDMYDEDNPNQGFYEVARTKASSWQILKRMSDDNGYTVTPITDIEQNSIRYIKINMTGHKPYGYQIYEVAVIAEPEEETTTVPETTTTTQAETTVEQETTTQAETVGEQETTTQTETTVEQETTTQTETTVIQETTTQTETTVIQETNSQAETTCKTSEIVTRVETTTKGPEPVTTTKVSVTTGGNSTSNGAQNSSKVDTKIPKTKIKKIPAKKKSSDKVKITLKKVSGIKGYQIKVSTSKKFSSSKKKTVTKNVKKQNATIKSKIFKGKKKLYVKVRAYKLVNGKKKYGAWSKIKKVNIKK